MLKIKDNVDLKELEKFGYRIFDEAFGYVKTIEKGMFSGTIIRIYKRDKEIEQCYLSDKLVRNVFIWHKDELNKENIQDLIQAGLVEKVEG